MTQIHGRVEVGWEAVRSAFAENFEKHGDVGGACCIYRDGRPVVDLWGGVADPESGRAWAEGRRDLDRNVRQLPSNAHAAARDEQHAVTSIRGQRSRSRRGRAVSG